MKSNKTEAKVLLGKIVGAQGIRGEVRIYAFGDAPSDFGKYEKALLVLPKDEGAELPVTIEKARIQGNIAIVKLAEINDRNDAESLRDAEIFVDEKDLEELPEDTYYVRDLEGLLVIDDDTGEEVGHIVEVIQNAAQDIYRIAFDLSGDAEALVPAVKEFIKSVDVSGGKVRIHFIEGMRG